MVSHPLRNILSKFQVNPTFHCWEIRQNAQVQLHGSPRYRHRLWWYHQITWLLHYVTSIYLSPARSRTLYLVTWELHTLVAFRKGLNGQLPCLTYGTSKGQGHRLVTSPVASPDLRHRQKLWHDDDVECANQFGGPCSPESWTLDIA